MVFERAYQNIVHKNEAREGERRSRVGREREREAIVCKDEKIDQIKVYLNSSE